MQGGCLEGEVAEGYLKDSVLNKYTLISFEKIYWLQMFIFWGADFMSALYF